MFPDASQFDARPLTLSPEPKRVVESASGPAACAVCQPSLPPHGAEVRRARPLLGTLVEIAVRGHEDPQTAIDAAFRAVERVQRLMSYHDPASDVSRLNRQAHRRPTLVDAATFEVLRAALALSLRTGGAFDVSIAPQLEREGLLPRQRMGTMQGTWRDIECLPGRRVRFRRPLRIDLGGIAKGHAVDLACEALRAHGVDNGLVNAGGDLRVVGSTPWPISVRHPGSPTQRLALCELADGAVATSAAYFLPSGAVRRARALVDGRTRALREWCGSVSVTASTCLSADALTKVVGVLGARASAMLMRERASACIIGENGSHRLLGLGAASAALGEVASP